MGDMLESIKQKAKALRDKVGQTTTQNPANPRLKPIEQRRRGYQLYAREAQTLGETPKSYEEWIAEQE